VFTGIVQALGTVIRAKTAGPGKRLAIACPSLAARATIGASIAVNGCCLTVVEIDNDNMSFDAGPETLSRTNLGLLAAGDSVNLEPSLRMGDELGGHLVTGHIDTVGTVAKRIDDADWTTMWFHVPAAYVRQMASKGSVAVDGVSLTLVDVESDRFSVALIPHTLAVTTLGRRQVGGQVNIETDLLAKYVEKQLAWKDDGDRSSPNA
jgi:riboflavin synthase